MATIFVLFIFAMILLEFGDNFDNFELFMFWWCGAGVAGVINLLVSTAFISEPTVVEVSRASDTKVFAPETTEETFQIRLDGYQETLDKVMFDIDEYNIVRNRDISEDLYVIEKKIAVYPDWYWMAFIIKIPQEYVKVTKHIAINTPVDQPVAEPVAENTDDTN